MTKTPSAKLSEPRVPDWFVRRPAVERRLLDVVDRRLTTVVAGPGFGKSTLLAAWIARRPHVWYTLDRADDSLARFGAGLVEALRQALPVLPPAATFAAQALRASDAEQQGQAHAFAGALCEALHDSLESHLLVVLDDVHELDAREPVRAWWKSFAARRRRCFT